MVFHFGFSLRVHSESSCPWSWDSVSVLYLPLSNSHGLSPYTESPNPNASHLQCNSPLPSPPPMPSRYQRFIIRNPNPFLLGFIIVRHRGEKRNSPSTAASSPPLDHYRLFSAAS